MSAHWVERAQALLAPLLFAAASKGLDMKWVFRWVLARDLREPLTIIERTGHEMAAATLAAWPLPTSGSSRVSSPPPRACSLPIAPRRSWPRPAGRTSTRPPSSRSTDSLYICAPAEHQNQLAPLVVALLDQISCGRLRPTDLCRPGASSPSTRWPTSLRCPALPALASEGGGQGVVTLACLQDLSQARARWGTAADGLFTLFGVKVILPGVADQRTLELISALGGKVEVPTTTVGKYVGEWGRIHASSSVSTVFLPRYPVDAIARGRPGHGLLINGSHIGEVRLRPWWERTEPE